MTQWLLDGLVIFAYFALVLGIGIYKGRGSTTMESFAIGNRNIPWWAVLASIVAAETSAATFLGAPNEGYEYRNFTYAQLALGTVLARVIIAFVFIKPYYDYRVVSIYDFLRVRFGERTKNVASGVFLVTRALASGTRLYVAAVVLVLGYEMITGQQLSLMQQLWVYVGALTFLSVMTAIYTTIGGIRAVVWTDVIQATVMFGSLGIAVWLLLHQIPGGLSGAMATLTGPKDLAFFDSGVNPELSFFANVRSILESDYTIWSALLGATFLTMATHGTDQDMVQRMLTAKDHVKSRIALVGSGLMDIPLVLCFLAVGILLWAFYREPEKANVFATYILHEMPPGVRGLLIAGIFATAMGSLSTALNALATSFIEDWYNPYIRPGAAPAQVVRAARRSTVVFSIILVLIGSATAYGAIVLQARIIPIVLGIFGYTYGSLLGVFLIGTLTRRRGCEGGNLLAMIIGFLVVAVLSGLHNDLWKLLHPTHTTDLWSPHWLVRVTFVWRIMIGTITTFLVGILFSTPAAQVEAAREHVAAGRRTEPLADS